MLVRNHKDSEASLYEEHIVPLYLIPGINYHKYSFEVAYDMY